MKGLLLRWWLLMCAIIVAAFAVDGISVNGLPAAVSAAAALGILNALLRPILFILTLPVNLLTFGLFTFVINAFLLQLASAVIPGFMVNDFSSALLGALIVSLVSSVLNACISGRGNIVVIKHPRDRRTPWD